MKNSFDTIGYVHFRWKNFLEENGLSEASIARFFYSRKKEVLKRVFEQRRSSGASEDLRDKIASRAKAVLGYGNEVYMNNGQWEQLPDFYLKVISDAVNEKLETAKYNIADEKSLTFIKNGYLNKSDIEGKVYVDIDKLTGGTNRQTIQKIEDNINTFLEYMNSEAVLQILKEGKATAFLQITDYLIKGVHQLTNNINNLPVIDPTLKLSVAVDKDGGYVSFLTDNKKKQIRIQPANEENGTIDTQFLSTLVNFSRLSTGYKDGQKAGAMFEALMYSLEWMLKNKITEITDSTVNQLSQALADFNPSKGTSRSIMKKSYYDSFWVDWQNLGEGKSSYTSEGDLLPKGRGKTADVVDLTMTLDGVSYNTSLKVKNLQDENRLHVRGGTNILTVIQEDTVFTNHYLNVLATHPRQKTLPSATLIAMAKQTLNLLLFEKSLIGGVWKVNDSGTYKTAENDFLIVADNSVSLGSSAKPKVYFIYEVLEKVANNAERYLTVLGVPNSLDNVWVNADEGGIWGNNIFAARERVKRIYQQVREMQYDVQLSNNLFLE